MTAAIALTAKRGNTLPGILPLFPLFGLIALLIIGAKNDINAFRETCLASAKTLPAYLSFVVACYVSAAFLPPILAVLLGLIAWTLTALMIFNST